jgi:putative transposase
VVKVEVNRSRGCVYKLQYPVVWCVKYRRKVLVQEVEQSLKCLLYQIAKEYPFEIVEMECYKDHVHLLIECKPQDYIPKVLQALKGTSARRLFIKHPELKKKLWKGTLWNPSYFIATVSDATTQQIRTYIHTQKIRSE